MTTVTVRRNEQGICAIGVSGHSGYAQAGSDIVCAAASVLITTCINALENEAHIRPMVFQKERTATMEVLLPASLPPLKAHDAQVILQTTVQGFQGIAEQYPKYLQIHLMGGTSSC